MRGGRCRLRARRRPRRRRAGWGPRVASRRGFWSRRRGGRRVGRRSRAGKVHVACPWPPPFRAGGSAPSSSRAQDSASRKPAQAVAEVGRVRCRAACRLSAVREPSSQSSITRTSVWRATRAAAGSVRASERQGAQQPGHAHVQGTCGHCGTHSKRARRRASSSRYRSVRRSEPEVVPDPEPDAETGAGPRPWITAARTVLWSLAGARKPRCDSGCARRSE